MAKATMPEQGITRDNRVNDIDSKACGDSTTITIAYTTHWKKRKYIDNLKKHAQTWKGISQPQGLSVTVNLIPLFDDDGITLTPAALQHRVHAVLHKRTDDMASAIAYGDQDASYRLSVLSNILQYGMPFLVSEENKEIYTRYPVVQIDPLSGVWRLVDRAKLLTVIDRAFGYDECSKQSGEEGTDSTDLTDQPDRVRTLPWTMIPTLETSTRSIDILLEASDVQFPVILKPRVACGDPVSHCMAVASNSAQVVSALQKVFRVSEPPSKFCEFVVAQQFVPRHDNVLFKIYAVAAHVLVQSRLSIGFAHEEAYNTNGSSSNEYDDKKVVRTEDNQYFYFDSQALSHKTIVTFDNDASRGIGNDVKKPDDNLAKHIIHKLEQQLDGISLLGVDIVYDVDKKTYFIVDVNYFPGYKHFPAAFSHLLQTIVDKVAEHDLLKQDIDVCNLSDHLTSLDTLYQCQQFPRDNFDIPLNLKHPDDFNLKNDELSSEGLAMLWKQKGHNDSGPIGENMRAMPLWKTNEDCLESEVDVIGRGGCINR